MVRHYRDAQRFLLGPQGAAGARRVALIEELPACGELQEQT